MSDDFKSSMILIINNLELFFDNNSKASLLYRLPVKRIVLVENGRQLVGYWD